MIENPETKIINSISELKQIIGISDDNNDESVDETAKEAWLH